MDRLFADIIPFNDIIHFLESRSQLKTRDSFLISNATRDGNRRIARAKYRSKRVLASNVTFVKLEISQDLISRNLTRYKITRNVLKRLLRFPRLTLIHPLFSFLFPFQDPFPRSFTSREKLEGELWFSDSPPNGKRSSNPSVEKKQRGIVYCACPGTNFPTECQIFVLDNLCGGGRGNIWQMHRCHYGPEPNVKREFWSQRPGGWILSLSLSFDPPQFSLGVEAFKGFVHFAFNWTSCGRDFEFVSAMMVDFRVWRILGDANL